MTGNLARKIKSRPITWQAGQQLPIDLSFLDQLSGMKYPEIKEIAIRFVGSVTTANDGTTFNSEDACRILAQIQLDDGADTRVLLSGTSLRAVAQREYGLAHQDPSQQAANTTNTAYEFILKIPYHLRKARRRADTRMPLSDLRGGNLSLTCCAANPVASVTVNSGTFEIWVRVIEARTGELKSRISWIEANATLAEDSYTINGAIRDAFFVAPQAVGTAGYQSITGMGTVTSQSLDLSQVPRTMLVDDYRQESTPDNTNDLAVAGKLYPIRSPGADHKLGTMPDLRTLHLLFSGSLPTGTKFVCCKVVMRNPTLSARAMGFTNEAELSAALGTHGVVKNAPGGQAKHVTQWTPGLRKVLPLRLQRGAGGPRG